MVESRWGVVGEDWLQKNTKLLEVTEMFRILVKVMVALRVHFPKFMEPDRLGFEHQIHPL